MAAAHGKLNLIVVVQLSVMRVTKKKPRPFPRPGFSFSPQWALNLPEPPLRFGDDAID